ncbi:MAG: flagellar basal body protein, partial [Alphaproteobacteria bacterium]|nr:flagellar basal body protein [Alphaproteobacteria bacterium]
MDTMKSMLIAASGMRAQAERMRVIAENLANASSTASSPDEDPYRRQVPV